jgi:ATP-dependent Clp protease ATP-binding subunit ClpC
MPESSRDNLFDSEGALLLDHVSPSARDLLDAIRSHLVALDRGMFLPLDLLIQLIDRGYDELADLVAEGAHEMVEPRDVPDRLRSLAKEIEDDSNASSPELRRACFSRGFSRILSESLEQAEERGDTAIAERDLARAVLWRVEAVESASVRWAIRRLDEGEGDELFDDKGLLCDDSFHDSIWRVLQGAMKIAASRGTPFLGTPHLVAMFCSIKDSIVWRSAHERGLEPSRLREELLRLIGSRSDEIPEFLIGRKTLTPRMIRILSYAASQAGSDPIREPHVVEGFLDDGGSSLELLQALGLESELRNALGEPKVLEETFSVDAAVQFADESESTPTLDLLGRDLTQAALEGELPPIVGRERELQRMVNILLRREQRNPLLTGEAGVGKTALASALAERMALGRVPPQLEGCRLVEINGASLIGGTSYRGDLESRIESLLEEAREDVILFIDEAHAVFAPRSGTNTPAEVPNHFKRALASGDLAVVAATTQAEYRRWFDRDPALKRRFERIDIEEPDEELVHRILENLVPELETEYGIVVDDSAIEAAIDLSVRYLPEQWLPDKAKKLLMDACIARANDLVDEETETSESDSSRVVRRDVAHQVHLKTSIPLDQLLQGEIRWWVGLEARLGSEVVGQPRAVSEIARTLISSRLRNARRERPMAVMGFVGPPGVGKTKMARTLADEIYNDPRAVIRLDMSDYQESHSLSRLIGSPPGYVGYDDEDILVTPLRRRPSSIVLLEDFDQAHPRIQERMLRFIEDGEIEDTQGHRATASNAMFILTFDASIEGSAASIGFEQHDADAEIDETAALEAIGAGVAERLEGYLDAVVPFDALSGADDGPARSLLDQRIESFVEAMHEEYDLDIEVGDTLETRILEQASTLEDTQAVEDLISTWLYEPTTEALLNDEIRHRGRLVWSETDEAVDIVRPPEHSADTDEEIET